MVILVLIVTDALQMAYRTAVMSLTDGDLSENEDHEEGTSLIGEPARSRIREVRENPARLTRSVWFLQILTAAFSALLLADLMPFNRYLTALIVIALVYLFGAAVPYLAAKMHPVGISVALALVGERIALITAPFTWVLSFISGIPARLAGVDPRSLEDRVSEDEIISLVNEGHEQGAIDEDEAEMITNIFELDDKQAQDIMTHRGDITAIDGNMSLNDALAYMVSMPNSRFPVIEEDIDHIIGALYLKDAISYHMKEQFNDQPISDIPHLLREVKFIPETVDVDDLFREMQESRKQMAIVVDEYGQTSGLVTMEDILEEIVGNILDEYDKEERLIARIGDGKFRINGKALLADVSKDLNTEFDQEHYDTISGYLTEKLGHIPTPDDRQTVLPDPATGYRFRIISTAGTMIGWLEAVAAPDLQENTEDNS
ncbi:MAG: HlyC/CorC family transporter [Lachnospiraceae bacterium]|nr:HlyC/CorC family transporter [Lachnospiraceae bacterium]